MPKKPKCWTNEAHPLWVDYHAKLSDQEKDFLNKFGGEIHLGIFGKKPLHKKKKAKEILNERNARRRDVLNVSEADVNKQKARRGRYSAADYSPRDEALSPEDLIIELIDKAL